MKPAATRAALQAQLAERDQEIARLRAELASWDVAERRRVEEQLRQSEEKARDLIRYAPTGIYEVDFRTGRFRSVNDAMCEILGYSREELLTMTAFELLDDAGKVLFADRIRRTLAGEKVDASVEYRVKTRDGHVIYGVLDTRITYHDGQPDGAFVIAHDVTERRRAADELAQQRERLGRLAAEQEAILAAIADGLVVYDTEGRIVRLNAAAEQLLGYSGDQRALPVQERSATLVKPLRPDGSPYPPDEFPALRALRGEVVTGQEMVLHVPARGGAALRLSVSSAPIRGPGGQVAGAVTTFSDTGAFYAMNQELRLANSRLEVQAAELEQANAELESFAYSVSHDLRAPLRAIDGFSRALLEDWSARLDAGSLQNLEIVSQSAQRMRQLIDDLLAFSRLGRQPLRKQQVTPAALVQQCLGDLQAELAGRKVELRVGDLPSCEADPALLRQVYMNLMSNALKFSRSRSPAVIEIGCDEQPDERIYYVRDNGVGFDMRRADKLFGVFQRLHSAAEYEGTGVGLANVKRIVQRHGGRVWAEAAPDKGAAFYFSLRAEDQE